MPKVFITQLPSRLEQGSWVPTVDVSPAKEHGELVFLVPPGLNAPTMDGVVDQLRRKLATFSDGDALLPLGDPILMATACAILGARQQTFRVLKWDRPSRRYYAFSIDPDIQPSLTLEKT